MSMRSTVVVAMLLVAVAAWANTTPSPAYDPDNTDCAIPPQGTPFKLCDAVDPRDCCVNECYRTNLYFFEIHFPTWERGDPTRRWPEFAPQSTTEVKGPLGALLPYTYGTLGGHKLNYSELLGTVVIRVNTSTRGNTNNNGWSTEGSACQIAAWYVRNLNSTLTSNGMRASAPNLWNIRNVTMGYAPVMIPQALKTDEQPNPYIFWIQGGVAFIVMIVQIVYQVHNHFTTDFRNMEELAE